MRLIAVTVFFLLCWPNTRRETQAHGMPAATPADTLLARATRGASGDLATALAQVRQAQAYFTQRHQPRRVAECLRVLSLAYYYHQDYANALVQAHRALALDEQLHDQAATNRLNDLIGALHLVNSDNDLARQFMRRALAGHRVLQDTSSMAYCYLNLATASEPRYDSCLVYDFRALPLFQQLGDHSNEAKLRNNIGHTYFRLGHYSDALKQLRLSEKLNQRLRDPILAASIYYNRGQIQLALGKPAAAVSIFQGILRRGIGDQDMRMDASRELAAAYAAAGRSVEAMTSYRRYVALHDSIYTAEKTAAISRLQVQYESAAKEKQILALQQQARIDALRLSRNRLAVLLGVPLLLLAVVAGLLLWARYRTQQRTARLLAQANDRLASTNQSLATTNHALTAANDALALSVTEKQTLMQEIHHRVKNNLQLISSLLSWQRRGATEPGTLEALDASRARVGSMALIHEYLYLSENIAHIDCREYLGKLLGFLARSYNAEGRVRLHAELAAVRLSTKQTVPLGLIVNELVSNAFKYAFPQPGPADQVWVDFAEDGAAGCRLTVRDNGVGLPPALLAAAPPPAGGRTSLGLQLVRLLTKQLGGTFEAAASPERGGQFTLTFPYSATEEAEAPTAAAAANPDPVLP